MTERLEAAYLATSYRIFLPGGSVDVRIGKVNVALTRWLKEEEFSTWVILTAYNPASQRLEAAENAERQSQLECALLEQGFLTFGGENVADDGAWPNEESCLVVDIDMQNSITIARRFGQNAIIYGQGGTFPV